MFYPTEKPAFMREAHQQELLRNNVVLRYMAPGTARQEAVLQDNEHLIRWNRILSGLYRKRRHDVKGLYIIALDSGPIGDNTGTTATAAIGICPVGTGFWGTV